MVTPSCPACGGYKSTEPIGRGGWWYCTGCSARLLCDEAGQVIRVVLGHADRVRPRDL